jgi:tetratricopeptide (TPR) repeat protein
LGVALHSFIGSRGLLDAIAHVRSALERSDPVPDELRSRALSLIGEIVDYSLGIDDELELRRSRELRERGLEMARGLDDQKVLAQALATAADSVNSEEDPTRKAALANEAIEVARSTGDPWYVGRALLSAVDVGPPEEKRARQLEVLAGFRQAGDIFRAIPLLWDLADLDVQDGRFEAARSLCEQALAWAEEINSPIDRTWSCERLSFLLLRSGEFDEAVLVSRKALIGARRLGHRFVISDMFFVLACCDAGTGDFHRAAQLTGAHDASEDAGAASKSVWVWTGVRQQARDDNRKQLLEALGEREFARTYGVGRALSLDEAFDVALGRLHPI